MRWKMFVGILLVRALLLLERLRELYNTLMFDHNLINMCNFGWTSTNIVDSILFGWKFNWLRIPVCWILLLVNMDFLKQKMVSSSLTTKFSKILYPTEECIFDRTVIDLIASFWYWNSSFAWSFFKELPCQATAYRCTRWWVLYC